VYDLARIQSRLPADAALVAWIDRVGNLADLLKPEGDVTAEHWACVVRARGEPAWLPIPGKSPKGAWTQDDMRLVGPIRKALGARPGDNAGAWRDLADRLAAQRLGPLAPHLQAGADLPPVRHLVVLQSPWMSRIPVEALTDRYQVSYAPSGTMFAWLRERPRARGAARGELLAVGDPAFAKAQALRSLPGTRREVEGIARLFPEGATRLLLGADADGGHLDRLARDNGLEAFRYLHLATHGKPDDNRPLGSYLALAAGADGGEGRLTAEHILRTWKLDADLVTLSACESGLGQFHTTEGYLGFAQALFLAGARSVVLSHWQVDDRATALLMTRFYENLLGKRAGLDRPLPRARALAEAKRWLRGLGVEEVNERLARLPGGSRGDEVKLEAAAETSHPYDHPHYWGAFFLLGDPGDVAEQERAGHEAVAAAPAAAGGGLPAAFWLGTGAVLCLLGTAVLLWRLRRRRAA
jgi:CHAT domain-containing protein